MVHRNLPPHALAFCPDPVLVWTAQDAQRWDCYGERFTTIEYDYLHGLQVKAKCNGGIEQKEIVGEYLFTAAPLGDGFSLTPEQSKEFTFVKLDNGRLTVQPTNFTIYEEKSFTANPEMAVPMGLKRQTTIWQCE